MVDKSILLLNSEVLNAGFSQETLVPLYGLSIHLEVPSGRRFYVGEEVEEEQREPKAPGDYPVSQRDHSPLPGKKRLLPVLESARESYASLLSQLQVVPGVLHHRTGRNSAHCQQVPTARKASFEGGAQHVKTSIIRIHKYIVCLIA